MSTLQICVNGKPVKQYSHSGKSFVEGRDGTEYTLKIHNSHYARRLAIVTVDGINVVSGEPQGDSIGRGYIVPAYSTIEIKGFRQDLSSVGAFKFCGKNKSYCNSQGASGNNGVIGVRFYNEKQKSTTYSWTTVSSVYDSKSNDYRGFENDDVTTCYTSYSKSSVDSDCGAKGVLRSFAPVAKSAPDFELGTTWGTKVNDSVTLTDFDNESWVSEEIVVYYDTRKNLEEIGISFKEEKHVNAFPKAFGGFANPPKGWRG